MTPIHIFRVAVFNAISNFSHLRDNHTELLIHGIRHHSQQKPTTLRESFLVVLKRQEKEISTSFTRGKKPL
jgi:hypothetical protein